MCLDLKPGLELLGPRALDHRWNFRDSTRLGTLGPSQVGATRPVFPQIPIPIQAFPYCRRPVLPSRQQIGGGSSVQRYFETVEVPSASHSSQFPVSGGFQAVPITLAYVKAWSISTRGKFVIKLFDNLHTRPTRPK